MAAARSGSAPAKADTEEKAAGGKGKKVDAEEWFRRAVEFVRTSSAPGTSAKVAMPKLSRDEQLRFYALFKQATEGPCAEPAPSRLQVVARMKWSAWEKLGKMSKKAAMNEYLREIDAKVVGWRDAVPEVRVAEEESDEPEVGKEDEGDEEKDLHSSRVAWISNHPTDRSRGRSCEGAGAGVSARAKRVGCAVVSRELVLHIVHTMADAGTHHDAAPSADAVAAPSTTEAAAEESLGLFAEDLEAAALTSSWKRLVRFFALDHPDAARFEAALPEALEREVAIILLYWFGHDFVFTRLGGRVRLPKPTGTLLDDIWQKLWFAKNERQVVVDADMTKHFAPMLERAASGAYDAWAERDAPSCLALIILLDQFSRNVFRGTPGAWATDAKALAVMNAGLALGFDAHVPPFLRSMFYMPLVHAEDLAEQERCDTLYQALLRDTTPDTSKFFDRFAVIVKRHKEVVRYFGRFPERNEYLRRPNTEREEAYLLGAQEGHTVKFTGM